MSCSVRSTWSTCPRASPPRRPSLVVNGLTAYRICTACAVQRGETIVVTARPAAWEPAPTHSPFTRAFRDRNRGTDQQEHLRALGVTPIHHRSESVSTACANTPRTHRSRLRPRRRPRHRRLLENGRTLVSYGTAATRRRAPQPGAPGAEADRQAAGLERPAKRAQGEILQLLAGPPLPPRAFRDQLRADLTKVSAPPRGLDHAADRRALPARGGRRSVALRRGGWLHGEGLLVPARTA